MVNRYPAMIGPHVLEPKIYITRSQPGRSRIEGFPADLPKGDS